MSMKVVFYNSRFGRTEVVNNVYEIRCYNNLVYIYSTDRDVIRCKRGHFEIISVNLVIKER